MDVIVRIMSTMAGASSKHAKCYSEQARNCRHNRVSDQVQKEQKMSQGLICYCFGYTAEDIRADLAENGLSTIMARIMKEKKKGRCNCASTNPKGR